MTRHHHPTSKEQHTKGSSAGQAKARVDDQKYDLFEQYTLETSRLFFVAFSQPETQFWMHAYRYCEAVYPKEKGARIAQATLDMLNIMRTTRPHTFNYTDPRCRACSEYLTSEERYLMESFRQTRKGGQAAARMNALLLCEGNEPSAFLRAAANLAEVMDMRQLDGLTL